MNLDRSYTEAVFSVGSPAVVHTNPGECDEKRYPTRVRGWHAGNYVLLDRPMTEDAAELSAKSQRCLLRFVSEGRACGFPCTIFKNSDAAIPYLRVSWPRKLECVDIRKHQRAQIRVPCKIARVDQPDLAGETTDLSQGGCGIWTDTRLALNTAVQLSFGLPDGSTISGARATVRNVRTIDNGFLLGCMFDEDEPACAVCDFFVTTTIERTRGCKNQKRALLLEGENDRAEVVRAKLQGKGYHVIRVSCLVDAFFSLRMAFPSCLWVGAEQAEIPVAEICRILRETNGLASLPIYVVGTVSDAIAEDLKRLDVACASSPDVMDRLLT
ncbi:MAG TPA: PilZ domain-containing protein [Candidatus Hydrogenedentes bacterium]|jgi:CheY-like chemotaxis protein|nr:PilZ domain-containing protein [Candidatus Hydrogenedentota bacterium]